MDAGEVVGGAARTAHAGSGQGIRAPCARLFGADAQPHRRRVNWRRAGRRGRRALVAGDSRRRAPALVAPLALHRRVAASTGTVWPSLRSRCASSGRTVRELVAARSSPACHRRCCAFAEALRRRQAPRPPSGCSTASRPKAAQPGYSPGQRAARRQTPAGVARARAPPAVRERQPLPGADAALHTTTSSNGTQTMASGHQNLSNARSSTRAAARRLEFVVFSTALAAADVVQQRSSARLHFVRAGEPPLSNGGALVRCRCCWAGGASPGADLDHRHRGPQPRRRHRRDPAEVMSAVSRNAPIHRRAYRQPRRGRSGLGSPGSLPYPRADNKHGVGGNCASRDPARRHLMAPGGVAGSPRPAPSPFALPRCLAACAAGMPQS